MIVKNGATTRVSDLGTVAPGAPDRTLLVTGNGQYAVVMSMPDINRYRRLKRM